MEKKRPRKHKKGKKQQAPPGPALASQEPQSDKSHNDKKTAREGGESEYHEKKRQWSSWARFKQGWEETRVADKMITVFTGMAAVFVTVSAILYGLQIRVVRRQLDIMERQLTHIEEASQLEQRAWIGIASASLDPIEPNQPATGRIEIMNTGKTPASIIQRGWTAFVDRPNYDVETLANLHKETVWKREPPIQRCFAPNAAGSFEFWTDKERPLSDTIIGHIKSGQYQLYVVGRIVYRDIFEGEHHTNFCLTRDANTGKMGMHHSYNYMD